MKILAVDIGTGTQDILLYDSALDIENCYKLVLPSPTMLIHQQVKIATQKRSPLLLTGKTMGGGPSQWAVENHLRAKLNVFATPNAARSFNDDLTVIEKMGIQVISEAEAVRVQHKCFHINMQDFNFTPIKHAFSEFGVSLDDLSAITVAVFDHGAAPPEVSDRKFRFDYLHDRIKAENRLSAFAYPAAHIPPAMTRLQAVASSIPDLSIPLIVMDTAPAAILGALYDPFVASLSHRLIANIGNFHTLAFRLKGEDIEGVFEHHTGLLTSETLQQLLLKLAAGNLSNEEVFNTQGHGALVYSPDPMPIDASFQPIITGPRRNLIRQTSFNPYFAAPFGDMMLTGCIGLMAATADHLPHLMEPILRSLSGQAAAAAPWDVF